MRIALLGFGTVGRGVYERWQEYKDRWLEAGLDVSFAGIAVRHPEKYRSIVPEDLLTTDVQKLITDPTVDTIVEVTSDKKESVRTMEQALRLGKAVVTANKSAVATALPQFLEAARAGQSAFRFEAAICGGIPVIEAFRRRLRMNRMVSLRGIVNGSSNYVLTELAKGRNRDEVMQEALEIGVLEADPTDDLEGFDAQNKLVILASMMLHRPITREEVPCMGISHIQAEDLTFLASLNRTARLVASVERLEDQALVLVRPMALKPQDSLAGVSGIDNQLEWEADRLGKVRFFGPGGGKDATADAVWSDLLALSGAENLPVLDQEISLAQDQTSLFYLRPAQEGDFSLTDEEAVEGIPAEILAASRKAAQSQETQEEETGRNVDAERLPHLARFAHLTYARAQELGRGGAVVIEVRE